jgi:urease accessory protein
MVRELAELDRAVTARKLVPGARLASTQCGRRLAALAPDLGASEPALGFCAAVVAGSSDGNVAVVEGALAASAGLGPELAAALTLRGAASSLLAAAVRLGRLGALRAQAILHDLTPAIEEASRAASDASLDDLHSTAPELDLHALRHARLDARSFVS